MPRTSDARAWPSNGRVIPLGCCAGGVVVAVDGEPQAIALRKLTAVRILAMFGGDPADLRCWPRAQGRGWSVQRARAAIIGRCFALPPVAEEVLRDLGWPFTPGRRARPASPPVPLSRFGAKIIALSHYSS